MRTSTTQATVSDRTKVSRNLQIARYRSPGHVSTSQFSGAQLTRNLMNRPSRSW